MHVMLFKITLQHMTGKRGTTVYSKIKYKSIQVADNIQHRTSVCDVCTTKQFVQEKTNCQHVLLAQNWTQHFNTYEVMHNKVNILLRGRYGILVALSPAPMNSVVTGF